MITHPLESPFITGNSNAADRLAMLSYIAERDYGSCRYELFTIARPRSQTKLANAKTGNYSAAFQLGLMYKDFGLIMAEGGTTSTPLPAVATARQIAAIGMARGLGNEDFSIVVRVMEALVQP